MNILRLVSIYLVLFFLLGLMKSYGVETPIVIGVGIAVIALLLAMPIYVLYASKNEKQIERFLKTNQKNPIFKYTYALAHGTKEDELQAIEAILAKYKQPMLQRTYLFARALLQDDLQTAAVEAQLIPNEPNRSYSIAYVEALKGNAQQARSYELSKQWMQYAIDAIIAYEAKDLSAYKASVEQTLAVTRGVQYYHLLMSFKKMTAELKVDEVKIKK